MESLSKLATVSDIEVYSSPVHKFKESKPIEVSVNFIPPTQVIMKSLDLSSLDIQTNSNKQCMNREYIPPLIIKKKKKEKEPIVFKPFTSFFDLEMTVKSLNSINKRNNV